MTTSRTEQPSAARQTGLHWLWIWLGDWPFLCVCALGIPLGSLLPAGSATLPLVPQANWSPRSPSGVTLPVMPGHSWWSRGSQQHTVFMQWGGTSASTQWNGQINSPLLAVLSAEKTHGSSECSGARGGAEERWLFLSTHKCSCLMNLDITLEAKGLGREVETGRWMDRNQNNKVHLPF